MYRLMLLDSRTVSRRYHALDRISKIYLEQCPNIDGELSSTLEVLKYYYLVQLLDQGRQQDIHAAGPKYLVYHLLFRFLPMNSGELQLTPLARSIPVFLDYLHSRPGDLDHRIILFKLSHNRHFQPHVAALFA